MRLTGTKIDVVTRTAPLAPDELAVSRLTADGLHGACRLQACLYVVSAGATWTVHRYAYRLTGGAVGDRSAVNVKLVSDGATAHVFDTPRDLVNDGRWYVHEHETGVPKDALTYARFEAWFDVPGLARRAWSDLWHAAPSRGARDRDARARVGPRPRHAQDVEGAAKGA
jgi:hypothetical protein